MPYELRDPHDFILYLAAPATHSGTMDWNEFAPAEDRSSAAEKLEKYSGEIDWSYLEPHYKAGTLLYVDPNIDLKTAGLAFAEDNTSQVTAWLKSGDLVEPCDLHVDHWKSTQTRFCATIVRPFILAQPIDSPSTHPQ